jgi:hypothetical protein
VHHTCYTLLLPAVCMSGACIAPAAPVSHQLTLRCIALLLRCSAAAVRLAPPTVFAYPGGASMEIHQALTRSEMISNILCRHEQVRFFGGRGALQAVACRVSRAVWRFVLCSGEVAA